MCSTPLLRLTVRIIYPDTAIQLLPCAAIASIGIRLELAPTMHAAAVRVTFPADNQRGIAGTEWHHIYDLGIVL